MLVHPPIKQLFSLLHRGLMVKSYSPIKDQNLHISDKNDTNLSDREIVFYQNITNSIMYSTVQLCEARVVKRKFFYIDSTISSTALLIKNLQAFCKSYACIPVARKHQGKSQNMSRHGFKRNKIFGSSDLVCSLKSEDVDLRGIHNVFETLTQVQ